MSWFNKKERTYQEIIDEIHSNLGEDKKENIKYLKEQAEKYKKHSMAHEILKEIGRLFTRNLDKEKLKELNSAIENDVTIHFQNGIEYLKKGNLDKAEDELNKYVQISTVMFKDDRIYKYFTPRNPIEYMLILNDENEKEFKETGTDFSSGYTYLGVIAVDKKNIKKAREMLELAFRWNPYNSDAIFEYNETFKMEEKLEEYKDKTLEFFSKLYDPHDLARFYRNLGYYYIEREEWELAKAIYIYSMRFDNNDKAKNELIYIMQKSNSQELPNPEKVKAMLEKYYIPTKISERNLKIIEEMLNAIIRDKQQDSGLGQYLKGIDDFYKSL